MKPHENFQIYSSDSADNKIDHVSTGLSLTTGGPNAFTAASSWIDSPTLVGSTNAIYMFRLELRNPVPRNGEIQITVPTEVTVPSNDASNLYLTCIYQCTGSNEPGVT